MRYGNRDTGDEIEEPLRSLASDIEGDGGPTHRVRAQSSVNNEFYGANLPLRGSPADADDSAEEEPLDVMAESVAAA